MIKTKTVVGTLKNIYEDALSYLGLDVSFEQVNVSSSTKSVESDYEVNRTFVDTLESGDEINLTESQLRKVVKNEWN